MTNFDDYQFKANMTRLHTADETYCFLNLAAEAGEVCALEAKLRRDGGNFEVFREKLLKELGDVLWHVAVIASDHGFSLEEVAEANIVKLTNRLKNNTISGNGDDR